MRFSNGGRIVGAETAEQSVNKGNDYKKGDNLSMEKKPLKITETVLRECAYSL